MPTYEYACQDCGEKLEVVQSIHDDSLTQCPNCGGKLRKLFGNVGVVFKGSGFYKTDSRAEKKKASTSSSSSSSSDSSSNSAEKKSETTTKSESTGDSSSTSAPKSTPVESSKPKSTS